MLFKSLLVLAILVPSCSTAVLRGAAAGCASANFTITSARYGNVHHYGVYEDLDLLEFAQLPPAYFCFTSNHALLEVKTRKCVGAINSTNLQLILTSNCNEPWTYISDVQELVDTNIGYCFSPWYYPLSPVQVGFVPGLSPCGEWNRMILNPNPTQREEEPVLN